MLNQQRMQGTIKRLSDKGHGFITPASGDADLFFHQSALLDVSFDQLSVGDLMTFGVEADERGSRATDVSRA